MRNKKGIVAGTLVIVIVLAVIFVVVLRFYSAILALIKALGEEYFWCLLRKVISAYTKVWPVGAQVWGTFCPPVIKTITLDTEGENMIPIDVSLTKKEIKNLKEWYSDKGYDFESRDWYLRYRLDQAIANGMKRCWGRNGEGELPLGPEWNDWFWSTKEYIFYCDLCQVYKFDGDIQQIFKEELSLNEFLKRNPVRPGSSESTWEYLKDDAVDTDLKDIKYRTDKDYAIVYVRGNVNNFNEILRDVFVDFLPGIGEKDHPIPIDAIHLTPFEDFDKLKCKT